MQPIRPFLLFLLAVLSQKIQAQALLTGNISDKDGPLPGAAVRALRADSSLAGGTIADAQGSFTLDVQPGKYLLEFSYVGYAKFFRPIAASNSIDLGTVRLGEDTRKLDEVLVKTTQTRGEQHGDTVQFNANAFKTNPDATAEDLVQKMPGITSDANGIKVNGETVQKVLVDGKPFFGDDPAATMKNLPAEIIDKVEILDKLSDQAQFTGFSDGEQKTINFITKKNRNNGQFGRIYAGGGVDENAEARYQSGAALNSFKGDRRITLLLLSNNINQQNFSTSDISSGAAGQPSTGGRGGNRSSQQLLTPNQNGITTTHSGGLNYSDKWGKKTDVSGSYFYNHAENTNYSGVRRNYFTERQLVYDQDSRDLSVNDNHRMNLRIEHAIDSANKIIFTPAVTLQSSRITSALSATNSLHGGQTEGTTTTSSSNSVSAYDASGTLLFQHRSSKRGRTISASVTGQLNEKNNPGSYRSNNFFSDTSTSGLDQRYSLYNYTKKASARLAYTEPAGKNGQVQIAYQPSRTMGYSDKTTRDLGADGSYSNFNQLLSNKYSNDYTTQRGGLSYRYQDKKIRFTVGADVQSSQLVSDRQFPHPAAIDQKFRNILPNAMFNYRFSTSRNLRIFYRTSTDIPTLSQLQDVTDISNPLQAKTGNSALKQTFDNSISARFGGFSTASSRNLMVFGNVTSTSNYIATATYILAHDSVVNGYQLRPGSQLTKPVNTGDAYSGRLFAVAGFPTGVIKSNLNFTGGLTYGRSPSLINGKKNFSSSMAWNAGIFAGSNISEQIDFSVGYNLNITTVRNTLQKQSDNQFFIHNTTAKVNWIFLKRWVLNTDVTHYMYQGLSQSYNQRYVLWNAYLGYKLMKDRSLEAKVAVFDILNQNRSISRTVNAAYTEDAYTTVLRRYLMFTLTYTLRNFSGTPPPAGPEGRPWEGNPMRNH